MKSLQILTTRNFNGVALDCYKADNEQDDFWVTREQIGRLLGYDNPRISVANIHNRNKERLDKFSRVINLITHEENRDVARDMTVYNFKGLLEICRYSNQSIANAVMDFLWGVADEIRRKGFYATPAKVEDILADPDSFIKILQELKAERAKVTELETDNKQWQAENLALTVKIEEDRPKVIFAEAVDASRDSILIGNLAKLLSQNGINIGQNRLFAWLREHGYLCNCKGERWNFPQQKYVEQGLFKLKKSVVNNPDGTTKVTHTPKVTGKGQIFFINGFLNGTLKLEE